MSIGSLALAVPLALTILGISMWTGAAPAAAHATLERTLPAANARLAAEPHRVVLFFDEPVSLTLGQLTVVGPGGGHVDTGYTPSDGGRTLTILLRPGAGAGTYVVSYRVISLDTHPVSGGFFFQVGSRAGAAAATGHAGGSAPPPVASGSASEDTTVRAVYAACRYAGFAGLLLLVGGVVFLVALWPDGAPDRRVVHQIWLGYGLVAAGSMGELVLQAPYAAGTPLTAITGAAFDDVVDTTFGTAHLVRLGLLAVAAPVLAALGAARRTGGRAPTVSRSGWLNAVAAALGVGLLVTWAYSGHAGTTVPAVSVPSDVVHLAAMAVWIGGLVVLATALLPAAGSADLRTALPRWSALAMVCVVALIVSGTVQALPELRGWSDLVQTTYGQLLLAKIGLLAVVLLIAGYSRQWVRRWYVARAAGPADAGAVRLPELTVDPARTDVRRLRRGVVAESLLAATAVAVAAMLIEAAPGRSLAAAEAPGAAHPITRHGAYLAAVRRGDVVIHIKVDPGVVGVQYIYLDATRPDGRRIPVRQWTLTVSNDQLGLDQVNVPVLIDTGIGHHYIYGSFTMTTAGTWKVQVTARTSDVDETVVSRTVRIRG